MGVATINYANTHTLEYIIKYGTEDQDWLVPNCYTSSPKSTTQKYKQ